ncbi:hypothetical protein Pcinc_013960 [Petrolisthes cinctipes]|uniref:Uncharacterized protein n=1 Tax=Petrolisthes cinctipes TaxID=88211 RepID=A0AAE1FXH3_PETCI|nr:hypothetical protein Pcinc_013960 [Petrolisthes cinctipes]
MALDIENIKAKLHTKDLEIGLLNTEVKTAFETITALQQRVDDLEQMLCPNSREQPQAPNNNPLPPHCLLLGDINLRRVLRSDLGENYSVTTIHGANLDLLRSWISEKLNWTPTELSTGEQDDMCFDGDDNRPVLNRLGAIRLLGSIEAQCPEFRLCKNWNVIKKAPRKVYNNTTSQTLLSRQPPRHSDYPSTARQPPPNMQIPGAAPRLSPGPAPRCTASLCHPSSSEYHTAAPRPHTEAPWAHVARIGHHAPEGAAISYASTFKRHMVRDMQGQSVNTRQTNQLMYPGVTPASAPGPS